MQQIVNVMSLMDQSDVSPQQVERLIDQLLEDDFLQQKWHSYHLVQDCLQQTDLPLLDMSAAIAEALEQEETYQTQILFERSESKSKQTNILHLSNWFKPQTFVAQFVNNMGTQLGSLGQVAIAASVSALVIVGVQQYNPQQSTMTTNHLAKTVVETQVQKTPELNTNPLLSNQLQTVNFDYSPDAVAKQQQKDNAVTNNNVTEEQFQRNIQFFSDHDLQRRLSYAQF